MLEIRKISKKEIIPNQWDGGQTFEYFIYPEDSSYGLRNFDFRLSSASITKTPSKFTKFSGYIRYLIMLDNELEIEKDDFQEKYLKHQVFKFDSNSNIVSFSLGNDFNLMVSKKVSSHNLRLAEHNVVSHSQWIVLYALAKTNVTVTNNFYQLEKDDCLVIKNFSFDNIELEISSTAIISELNL